MAPANARDINIRSTILFGDDDLID